MGRRTRWMCRDCTILLQHNPFPTAVGEGDIGEHVPAATHTLAITCFMMCFARYVRSRWLLIVGIRPAVSKELLQGFVRFAQVSAYTGCPHLQSTRRCFRGLCMRQCTAPASGPIAWKCGLLAGPWSSYGPCSCLYWVIVPQSAWCCGKGACMRQRMRWPQGAPH